MDSDVVHIFWDNSNLFISAQDACDDRKGGGKEPGHRLDVRLHFDHVLQFAAAGREIEKATAAGSVPPGLVALWDGLARRGVQVDLQERGADSGKEQAVDEVLKLAMLRSVLERQQAHKPPCVGVLLSGDGDFANEVELMLGAGWGVEVLAFGATLSPKLKRISTGYAGRGKYVLLDDWYDQLVYRQAGDSILRHAAQVDLHGRPKV
jgi:hypothetical protein